MDIQTEIWSGTIDSALERLKERGINIRRALNENCVEDAIWRDVVVTCEFNGVILKETDTIDEAYTKVLGVTKEEFDEERRKEREEYERKEREWKESIPAKTQEYYNMGRGIIREDKYDFWDEIVPIRLRDLYHGMELDATLDILREWNESGSYKKCHDIIVEQGHSGWSHGLVVRMVKTFAKGDEESVDKLVSVLNDFNYKEEE